MRYRKNYLTKAIFQVRFDPILKLEQVPPASFQERIKEQFPRLKEGRELLIGGPVSPKDGTADVQVQSVRNRWTFSPPDAVKALAVSAEQFSLEYDRYDSMEVMRADFQYLWGAFLAEYQLAVLNRVGLRYINEIRLASGSATDWRGWISAPVIAGVLGVPTPQGVQLSRSMSLVFWEGEDYRIRFQYGVHNSDFPNPVVKREFILDYDCFSTSPLDVSQVENCLRTYNEMIDALFEQHIGDELRKDMGPVKD